MKIGSLKKLLHANHLGKDADKMGSYGFGTLLPFLRPQGTPTETPGIVTKTLETQFPFWYF